MWPSILLGQGSCCLPIGPALPRRHEGCWPHPPSGWPGRAGWRKAMQARGPVGFLLQSLRAYGLALGDGEDGPQLQQQNEILAPMAVGPA